MGEVADLFASLGVRIDERGFAKGDSLLDRARRSVEKLNATQDAGAKRAELRQLGSLARQEAGFERRATREEQIGQRLSARQEQQRQRGIARAEKAHQASLAKTERSRRQAMERAEADSRRQAAGFSPMLAAVGAYFGARAAYSGLVKFNATLEDSKDEIAGMLALAKNTDLKDQLSTADMLMGHLQERASKLPGTTSEYIAMLSMITQPITDAKLGLQDLEDMTVNSVVAAKGLHVPWEVAARDIDQAIRGQFHSTDPFSGKVLGSIGYKGEEGRSRFNQLTQEKRASEFKRALGARQFQQLGEASGASFNGLMSTLQDTIEIFFGKVGKPLFEALKGTLKEITVWIEQNDKAIKRVAADIGEALVTAFNGLKAAVKFLIDHQDLLEAIIVTLGAVAAAFALAWIASLWPVFLVIAVVTALVYAIRWLLKHPEQVQRAFGKAFDWIADKFVWFHDQIMAIGERIKSFFVDDIPNAIRGAWESMFNWIADKIPGLRSAMGNFGLSAASGEGSSGPSMSAAVPTLPPGRSGGSVAMNVDVGGINVTSNASDPAAVAQEVSRTINEELGNHYRRAMDELA